MSHQGQDAGPGAQHTPGASKPCTDASTGYRPAGMSSKVSPRPTPTARLPGNTVTEASPGRSTVGQSRSHSRRSVTRS